MTKYFNKNKQGLNNANLKAKCSLVHDDKCSNPLDFFLLIIESA